MRLVISIGILIFLVGGMVNVASLTENPNSNYLESKNANGVVLIDDTHLNDYAVDRLTALYTDLEALDYEPFYISDFTDLNEALLYGNYLIMTAPYSNILQTEIDSIVAWAESGTRGILLASRGDYEAIAFSTINNLLEQLGADTRVQDDNVYSTKPWSVSGSAWSTSSSNIKNTVPELVTNVNQVAMFSPSSLRFVSSTADVIIYGDEDEYQTDQNTPPAPITIYDNTANGVGGSSIPLAAHEIINVGTTSDKLVITGTTMWSDFDYPDNLDNIVFFRNVIDAFKDHIITIDGSVSTILPDVGPTIKILYPRADSVVKGTISVSVDITDRISISTTEIYIDNILKSSSNTYSWDTTLETKGEHVIKVMATNVNAIASTFSQTVVVDQNYVPVVSPFGKIMEYNIRLGGEYPEWLDVMKEENADIAVLVETGGWEDNNNELLSANLNILNTYFDDEVDYQGVVDIKEAQTSGVAILSRYPINSANELTQVTLDDGTSWTPSHDFLHADLQIGNENVALIAGHLKCCTGSENENKRERAQEGIINYMDDLGDMPIIYAGDMNSEYPGEPTDLGTVPVSMLVDPTNEFSSNIHTFIDVHKKFQSGDTLPTFRLGSRIDFIFINQHLVDLLESSSTGDTESADIGSDHFTVDATLDFRAFLGLPTTSVSSTISSIDNTSNETSSTTDSTSSSKKSDSSLRFDFVVLPVIFLIAFRLIKRFHK